VRRPDGALAAAGEGDVRPKRPILYGKASLAQTLRESLLERKQGREIALQPDPQDPWRLPRTKAACLTQCQRHRRGVQSSGCSDLGQTGQHFRTLLAQKGQGDMGLLSVNPPVRPFGCFQPAERVAH
jgi:hypothetical protein